MTVIRMLFKAPTSAGTGYYKVCTCGRSDRAGMGIWHMSYVQQMMMVFDAYLPSLAVELAGLATEAS